MSDGTEWVVRAGPSFGMALNLNGTVERWQTDGEGIEIRWTEIQPPSPYPRVEHGCDVYWGSHGCALERGHDGSCECDCARNPWTGELEPKYDAEGVHNVGAEPYYGPDTRFYGDDVRERGLRHVEDHPPS